MEVERVQAGTLLDTLELNMLGNYHYKWNGVNFVYDCSYSRLLATLDTSWAPKMGWSLLLILGTLPPSLPDFFFWLVYLWMLVMPNIRFCISIHIMDWIPEVELSYQLKQCFLVVSWFPNSAASCQGLDVNEGTGSLKQFSCSSSLSETLWLGFCEFCAC